MTTNHLLRNREDAPRERNSGITLLFVDARAWTREAFARALERTSRDVRVLRFDDASELEQVGLNDGTAIILLNVSGMRLSDPRMIAAVKTAFACQASVPVVALSDSGDPDEILRAVELGLRGYIPISLELRQVVSALRFVAAGGTFVPAEPLLAHLEAKTPPASTQKPSDRMAAAEAVLRKLTPRELAVLPLLHEGKSNKQVARELGMGEATVKVHVRHIMRKLGAANRTQIALLADSLLKLNVFLTSLSCGWS